MLSIISRNMSIWWDASLSHPASTLSLTPYLATWLVLRLLPSGLIRFLLVGPYLRVLVRLAILGALLDLLVLGRGSCAVQSGIWGLESLELREIQHVCIGNVLLQAALDMLLAFLLTGGSAFIEHPAEPSWHSVAAALPYLEIAGDSCSFGIPCGS